MVEENDRYYLIGEMAKICEIPAKTLRYYDEIGLLKPDRITEHNGYRYYAKNKILSVLIIKYCKRLGFKLEDIKTMLPREDIDSLQNQFLDKIATIEADIQDLLKKHKAVVDWYGQIYEGIQTLSEKERCADFDLPVEIKKMPIYHVVGENYITEKKHDFDEILINKNIINTCEKNNIYISGPVIIFYDQFQKRIKNDCRQMEVCISVFKDNMHGEAIKEIGGKKAVTSSHIGSHENIGVTYTRMIEWAEKRQISLDGSSYEKYNIDPWSTTNSDYYVTEIFLGIKA